MHPDRIPSRGYLANYVGEPFYRDSLARLQESPLISARPKQLIQENRVSLVPGAFLQRQGNQISEATLGHSVLAREKSVV
jgi:hypothetical protein